MFTPEPGFEVPEDDDARFSAVGFAGFVKFNHHDAHGWDRLRGAATTQLAVLFERDHLVGVNILE